MRKHVQHVKIQDTSSNYNDKIKANDNKGICLKSVHETTCKFVMRGQAARIYFWGSVSAHIIHLIAYWGA